MLCLEGFGVVGIVSSVGRECQDQVVLWVTNQVLEVKLSMMIFCGVAIPWSHVGDPDPDDVLLDPVDGDSNPEVDLLVPSDENGVVVIA